MFDIGFLELLVIGIVALIVVGPKDLPGMFQTLGRFTGRMRGMARDFQRAMNDAANDTGLKETAEGLKAATSKKSLGLDSLDKAATSFEKWDPMKSKPTTPKPTTPKPTAATTPAKPSSPPAAPSMPPPQPAPQTAPRTPVGPAAARQKNMPVKKAGNRPVKKGR